MAYRVRVTRSDAEGAYVIDPRSAALLCLEDGDELVVERVIHRPCRAGGAGISDGAPGAALPASQTLALPDAAGEAGAAGDKQPGPGPGAGLTDPAPTTPARREGVARLPVRGRDEIDALKRAFRRLGN